MDYFIFSSELLIFILYKALVVTGDSWTIALLLIDLSAAAVKTIKSIFTNIFSLVYNFCYNRCAKSLSIFIPICYFCQTDCKLSWGLFYKFVFVMILPFIAAIQIYTQNAEQGSFKQPGVRNLEGCH